MDSAILRYFLLTFFKMLNKKMFVSMDSFVISIVLHAFNFFSFILGLGYFFRDNEDNINIKYTIDII